MSQLIRGLEGMHASPLFLLSSEGTKECQHSLIMFTYAYSPFPWLCNDTSGSIKKTQILKNMNCKKLAVMKEIKVIDQG